MTNKLNFYQSQLPKTHGSEIMATRLTVELALYEGPYIETIYPVCHSGLREAPKTSTLSWIFILRGYNRLLRTMNYGYVCVIQVHRLLSWLDSFEKIIKNMKFLP